MAAGLPGGIAMDAKTRSAQLREAHNPLFNDRKLKLGTFCSNLSHGCAISKIDGVLKAEWPSTLELARMSDEMEFEALVPVGRWKGFGGETNFNGAGFESFTWAAGIGSATKKAGIFATSHVPTIHPVMAAKQSTTIDHITGGRFNLNIVTGWYQPEIEMFGEPMLEHDERYERAAEWLEIIKLLWTREDEFDFDGRYYHIKKGWLQPKPIQKPYPVVMNAGGSPKGRNFAARHCDVSFIAVTSHDPAEIAMQVEAGRRLAREEYGRDIQIWTNAYIVQRDTEDEAKKFFDYYVNEQGDWDAVENLTNFLGINSQTFPPDVLRQLKMHFIGGWAGVPLIGTKEQVVDGLIMLAKAGFDGVILSWARYVEEMREFQRETYPLIVQAGVR
jgi:alkanesulfonate monooxygenase SsuD/methylene tetrahydromethanopterin reductase-like flavin-dependent oxidoreductase (luciferase family)